MTKIFCNKCGRELSSGNYRTVRMYISPMSLHGEIKLEFCKECLKEILGEEEHNAMIKREAERKQKIDERRKKRESENNE